MRRLFLRLHLSQFKIEGDECISHTLPLSIPLDKDDFQHHSCLLVGWKTLIHWNQGVAQYALLHDQLCE